MATYMGSIAGPLSQSVFGSGSLNNGVLSAGIVTPRASIAVGSNRISGSVFGPLGSVGVSAQGQVTGVLRTPIGGLTVSGLTLPGSLGELGAVASNTIGSVSSALGSIAGTASGFISNVTNQLGSLAGAVSSTLLAGKPLTASTISSSLGSPNPTWNMNSGGAAGPINSITQGASLRQPSGPINEPNALTKLSALKSALNRGDPVLSYEWVAIIVDPANPMTIEPIYIESLQAPTISFDQKMRFADGANLSYAGSMSVGQMSITLMADAYGKAFKLANNWIFSIYDQVSGGFYAPSDYKKSVKLFIHDAKKGVIVQFDFLGVYPVSWNGHTWNQSSEQAPVQLSLSVDRVRVSGSAYWTDQ